MLRSHQADMDRGRSEEGDVIAKQSTWPSFKSSSDILPSPLSSHPDAQEYHECQQQREHQQHREQLHRGVDVVVVDFNDLDRATSSPREHTAGLSELSLKTSYALLGSHAAPESGFEGGSVDGEPASHASVKQPSSPPPPPERSIRRSLPKPQRIIPRIPPSHRQNHHQIRPHRTQHRIPPLQGPPPPCHRRMADYAFDGQQVVRPRLLSVPVPSRPLSTSPSSASCSSSSTAGSLSSETLLSAVKTVREQVAPSLRPAVGSAKRHLSRDSPTHSLPSFGNEKGSATVTSVTSNHPSTGATEAVTRHASRHPSSVPDPTISVASEGASSDAHHSSVPSSLGRLDRPRCHSLNDLDSLQRSMNPVSESSRLQRLLHIQCPSLDGASEPGPGLEFRAPLDGTICAIPYHRIQWSGMEFRVGDRIRVSFGDRSEKLLFGILRRIVRSQGQWLFGAKWIRALDADQAESLFAGWLTRDGDMTAIGHEDSILLPFFCISYADNGYGKSFPTRILYHGRQFCVGDAVVVPLHDSPKVLFGIIKRFEEREGQLSFVPVWIKASDEKGKRASISPCPLTSHFDGTSLPILCIQRKLSVRRVRGLDNLMVLMNMAASNYSEVMDAETTKLEKSLSNQSVDGYTSISSDAEFVAAETLLQVGQQQPKTVSASSTADI